MIKKKFDPKIPLVLCIEKLDPTKKNEKSIKAVINTKSANDADKTKI